jgi:hypothetical protein
MQRRFRWAVHAVRATGGCATASRANADRNARHAAGRRVSNDCAANLSADVATRTAAHGTADRRRRIDDDANPPVAATTWTVCAAGSRIVATTAFAADNRSR